MPKKLYGSTGPEGASDALLPQTPADKARIRSIYVVIFTLFIDSVMFSITLPSMAIYLQNWISQDDPSYGLWLGLLVAAHPFGQLIGSPMAGWHFNVRGVREPMIIYISIFMGGCLFYAMARSEWLLLLGRLVQGFGDGNLAICRAFTAQASTEGERIKYLSWLSGAQAMGFLLGSVFGGILSLINFQVGSFSVDEFTAPGYFSFLLGFVNLVLVHKVLKELDSDSTANKALKSDVEEAQEDDSIVHGIKPDTMAVGISMWLWFVAICSFSIIETIVTPYLDVVYEWSVGEIACVYGCGSIIAMFAFGFIHKAKKVHSNPERYLQVFGFSLAGFGLIFAGGLMLYSAELWQWIIGMVIFFIGHPFAMASTLSLYSKICGPQKQGIYMGMVTAFGSLGRIVSPLWSTSILVSEEYSGTWTYSSTGLMMWTAAVAAVFFWKKMVPHPMQQISTDPVADDAKLNGQSSNDGSATNRYMKMTDLNRN